MRIERLLLFSACALLISCQTSSSDDAGVLDGGELDAGILDAGDLDAGVLDGDSLDAGALDASLDAGNDSGFDADNGTDLDRDGSDIEPPICARRVFEDSVTNARELGGYPVPDGRYIDCGKLFRGGQLSNLGDDSCTEFAALGIRTVIDLRMEGTQTDYPAVECVTTQADIIDAAMPKLLPDTPENYTALFEETEAISAMFSAIGAADAFPAYVHCVIGRDRASFASALILLALGADDGTVITDFELSADAGVTVQTDCIQAVLDEVENRGGIDAFLTSTGVTPQQLQNLKDQVLVNAN